MCSTVSGLLDHGRFMVHELEGSMAKVHLSWDDWDLGRCGLRRGPRESELSVRAQTACAPALPQDEKQMRTQKETVSAPKGLENLFGI